MRVAHLADIHIRLLKRHEEYRQVFENTYKTLSKLNVDRIVLVGDVFHNKVNLSPEAVKLGREFLENLSMISKLDVIVGNHDCIVNQPHRLNTIRSILGEPISENAYILGKGNTINLFEDSGIYNIQEGYAYGVFAINDEDNFPIDFEKSDDIKYIALFHGAMNSSKLDNNYTLQTENSLKMFENYDYALLGDIHKMQFLKDNVAYSGSLIQQDFGEEIDKGFIVWNFEDNEKEFVKVKNKFGFVTIHVKDNDDVENININTIPENPYVRVFVDSKYYSPVTTSNIASKIKQKLNPKKLSVEIDVSSLDTDLSIEKLEVENVADIFVQQKLLKQWLEPSNLTHDEKNKIYNIHSEVFHGSIQDDIKNRGSHWEITKVNFSNTFSYGGDNTIDFRNLNGLIGIFSPNRYGKSSLLRTILNGLFNMSDKVSRNNVSDLINNRKDAADIELFFNVDNRKFVLRRKVSRIKNNPNKGRTTVRLWEIMHGEEIPITGESNVNETEREVRSLLGLYDDHKVTTFGMQNDLTSFIDDCQAARKEKLSRFIGLDVISEMYTFVKGECDNLNRLINQYRSHDFKSIMTGYVEERDDINTEIKSANDLKKKASEKAAELRNRIYELKSKIKTVDSVGLTEDVILNTIENVGKQIIETKDSIEEINAEIVVLKNMLYDLMTKTKNIDKNDIAEKKSKIEDSKNDKSECELKLTLIEKDIQGAEKYASTLNKHEWFETNGFCKKCTFLKDAFKAKNLLGSMNKEHKLLSEKLASLVADVESNVVLQKDIDQYNNDVLNLQITEANIKTKKADIKVAKIQLGNYESKSRQYKNILETYKVNESNIKFNEKLKEEITESENRLNTIEVNITDIEKIISENNIKLGAVNQKINDLDDSMKKMNDIEDQYRLTSILKDFLSKDGIQIQIIKKVIPKINIELNKILAHIPSFDMIVEIDDDSQDVDIFIDDGNSKRRLELGSGMESVIGSIALRAALANISLIPRCNLFVIDEGFGALDPDNLNNVNNLLGYLKTLFKTVIIISHIDFVQDIVDNQISISKDDNGFSKLKIGD